MHAHQTERQDAGRAQGADARQRDSHVASGRVEGLRVLALAMLREVDVLASGANSQEACEINLAEEVRRFEAEVIRATLIRTGGRQRRAARLLGMKVSTLNAKIKRYRINSADDSGDAQPINVETEVPLKLAS